MENSAVQQISLTRFNALGGYARAPGTWLVFDELEYFEVTGGNVIGIITKDHADQDFGGLVRQFPPVFSVSQIPKMSARLYPAPLEPSQSSIEWASSASSALTPCF